MALNGKELLFRGAFSLALDVAVAFDDSSFDAFLFVLVIVVNATSLAFTRGGGGSCLDRCKEEEEDDNAFVFSCKEEFLRGCFSVTSALF